MKNEITFPTGYTPYDELHLCSNTLINVKIPFLIGDTPLLLIGKNTVPNVWLSAQVSPGSHEWKYIVEENRSLNPAVYVDADDVNRTVSVRVSNKVIIKVVAQSTIKAVVEVLDFRPLGLNVHGDKSVLSLATNKYAGNSMKNSRVAFALGN